MGPKNGTRVVEAMIYFRSDAANRSKYSLT